jgi:hypothetical protein
LVTSSHAHGATSASDSRVIHGNDAHHRWKRINKERTACRAEFLKRGHGVRWLIERMRDEFPDSEEVFAQVVHWLRLFANEYYQPTDPDRSLDRAFACNPALDDCFWEVTCAFVKWPSHESYWEYLEHVNAVQDRSSGSFKIAIQIAAYPSYARIYEVGVAVVLYEVRCCCVVLWK